MVRSNKSKQKQATKQNKSQNHKKTKLTSFFKKALGPFHISRKKNPKSKIQALLISEVII